MPDTFFDRELARRMQDPEFRETFERERLLDRLAALTGEPRAEWARAVDAMEVCGYDPADLLECASLGTAISATREAEMLESTMAYAFGSLRREARKLLPRWVQRLLA